MRKVVVTNNPMVRDQYEKILDVDFVASYGYLDVLDRVRRLVHRGWIVATHPLSGSIKPNETPYKSIIMQPMQEGSPLDYQSLNLIEEAIQTYQKFHHAKKLPQWKETVLEEFQIIDKSLIDSALPSMGLNYRS
ncbi:MAG: GrdX family protein [Peptoniphilaceae bacterium]|jgi:hypothetical protein